jgi:hypothetical protein
MMMRATVYLTENPIVIDEYDDRDVYEVTVYAPGYGRDGYTVLHMSGLRTVKATFIKLGLSVVEGSGEGEYKVERIPAHDEPPADTSRRKCADHRPHIGRDDDSV